MKPWEWVVFVMCMVVVAAAIVYWFFEGWDIDRCLDRGGAWDEARNACRFE
ncbi:hypothetical protein MVI01_53910 [Myxococcus virescens]|uniref:Uncharacterized protein n=1 Tax=Myxococcus virescens TaxID=83456 RepID=A0A511HJ61_9BACT|nr:hypothetical protein MVI01_53910 [Myxococcus virescens]SDE52627.1 hypothetical protein SAMN04488504_10853 [Myxococcus virescens]